MHSRIFCLISKNLDEEVKDNIREKFEDLTENDFYEQFQFYGADYCNGETDLREDWKWLGNYCETYEEDDTLYVKFDAEKIKAYVEERMNKLKEKVDSLSVDNFHSWDIFEIKNLAEDQHSFWLLIDDQWDDYSLDGFMFSAYEHIRDGKEFALEYEVVRSVDYHF